MHWWKRKSIDKRWEHKVFPLCFGDDGGFLHSYHVGGTHLVYIRDDCDGRIEITGPNTLAEIMKHAGQPVYPYTKYLFRHVMCQIGFTLCCTLAEFEAWWKTNDPNRRETALPFVEKHRIK